MTQFVSARDGPHRNNFITKKTNASGAGNRRVAVLCRVNSDFLYIYIFFCFFFTFFLFCRRRRLRRYIVIILYTPRPH